MSVTKEALIRYRAINNVLVQNKTVSQQKLIDVCTEAIGDVVAWRTIAGDINAMRHNEQLGYLAPIKNKRGIGYWYEDPNYSIDQIPLQNEEITALSFAAKLLMQYSHVNIFSTFSGAVEKLSRNLEVQIKHKDHSDLGAFIAFEDFTSDGGSIHLNEILQHIRQKTVISVLYNSFSSGVQKTHIVHPYFIKEYRNRWYVLCFHEQYAEVRTLALERIIHIKPNYGVSYLPCSFDVANFYKDAVGVSITNNKAQNIEIKVSKAQWQYLQSQPLHPSQQCLQMHEDYVVVGMRVINNYELRSMLLSMGSSVTVIKPTELRLEILNEVEQIRKNYIN